MQKRVKRLVINILAVIILFIIALVVVTLKGATSREDRNGAEDAASSFVGPDGNPSGVKGPSGPPPSSN